MTMATTTKNWFVLRVASNREDQVRDALERKVKIEKVDDLIGRILVPTERIKRVKGGQQKVAERKLYPGYVFVEMELNNDGTIPERAYYLFKDTQGVGDFIGNRNKPTAMATKDVEKMLVEVEKAESQSGSGTVKVEFKKGDPIKIKEGPFENFEGTVDEIFPDKGVVRVIVTIFGRATPLELEYWQLEKVEG
jgi:transcription termination/antitermination protein NusG